MTEQKDGGPAFLQKLACGRTDCEGSSHIRQGHQHLCRKHYRFGSMRARAKRDGKTVPSYAELEVMIPVDFCCPDCKRPMNWLAKDGNDTVVTLQHYRDGSLALVCLSCNTRHAFAPGDSYRQSGGANKHCPHCLRTLPTPCFSKDGRRSGVLKLKSWCKTCSSEAHCEWRKRKVA